MLPTLVEKSTLSPALINGVTAASTTASGTQTATVTFLDENAGFLNTLGYVTVASDGTLGTGGVVFQSVDGPDRKGGPLTAGDSVEIGTFSDGTQVDLFLIQNGDDLGIDFSDGSFSFENAAGGAAKISDAMPPTLIFTATDGVRTEISSPVFHSAGSNLNSDGTEHVVSATDSDGSTLLSFEDIASTAKNFDGDFNDATFDLTFTDSGTTPVIVDPDDNDQTTSSPAVSLPDGQEVAIQISTETTTDDDVADLSGTISLTGFLGSNFNIAYIMDNSGSTSFAARDGNSALLDIDGDGLTDTVLDVEQAAFAELNDQLIINGLGNADLGVISFGSSASIDATTTISADVDGNGITDGIDAINNPQSSGGTNFAPPLQQAIDFFNAQDDVDTASNIVYFISDGQNFDNFGQEITELTDSGGINAIVNAIGAGSGADQTTLDQIDNTGGSQIITDLSQLAAGLSASSLDINDILTVDISVNGVVQQTLDSSAFVDTPTGPQFGPVQLTGLDPNDVNDVDIDAVLETDDGQQFQLSLVTTIVGSGSSTSSVVMDADIVT